MGVDVSKVSEEGIDETALSEFCGRRKDVDEIVRLITKKGIKTLCVHGAKSIGKTRVINRVLMNESLKCFQQIAHVDCSMFSEGLVDKYLIPFLKELYKSVGLETNLEPCGTCELCTQKTGCAQLNHQTLLREVSLTLKVVQVPTLICFDDADLLLNSSFKQQFLDFIKTVTEKRKNIKLLVASTIRFHMTSRAKEMYLVDKMGKEDLKKLIVQILKPDEEDEDAVDYLSNLRAQDPWLEAVAILCDGMPKCAELLGTILREDDYLIEPIEVVQLLLTNFIQTLNPDLFAKEDRPTAKYREELEKFKEKISQAYQERWLYEIAETMEEGEITPEEALKVVQDGGSQVAKGTFKMDGLRKMMDNSILQKREKTSVALSMQRLYQHLLVNALNLVKDKDDDGLNLGTYIGENSLALIKEDAKKIDINLDHAGNLDAVKIERVLNRREQRMKRDDSGRSSGEEHEDDSGNDSNDSFEESKQRMEQLIPYKEQCYDQGLNSGYGRLDSTFGPAAMSYRPIGSSTVDANCITNKETTLANHLVSDFNGHNDNYGETYSQQTELETEHSYFREFNNDAEIGVVETVEYLNNTYPTTVLRKDLQTKEDQPNRERHSSTNELCPSHFHRMGSQDYDVSIGNEYVDIGEARHSQGHESPIQRGDKVRVRYSDSSTDSGEFKLGFETKTVVSEK